MSNTFFITGCARSGTTSLCRILDQARNARCLSEPDPKLNRESRDMIEGRLQDPRAVLEKIRPRISESHALGLIHGEKLVTLIPFLPLLRNIYDCKIIYIYRDGRSVVRSLLDWHNNMFGNIYRECTETGNLNERAFNSAANLLLDFDGADYSRPRPLRGDPYFLKWNSLTRMEMCAWYWSYTNNLALDMLERIPQESWLAINYTSPKTRDILNIGNFLGLQDLSENTIEVLLKKNVNSIKDRTGEETSTPYWQEWELSLQNKFWAIAEHTMKRLDLLGEQSHMPLPPAYGQWWLERGYDLDWYEEIFKSRKQGHAFFMSWFKTKKNEGLTFNTVLDVGCGMSVGYADFFSDLHFTGVDLSSKAIQWCQENRIHPGHEYYCLDIIQELLPQKYDLVFSQGSIDNVYDVGAFISSLVRMSNGWIYVSAYRGWFPQLENTKYTWDETTSCFYNNISPSEIRTTLTLLGCTAIEIFPVPSGKPDTELETVIIAQAPCD